MTKLVAIDLDGTLLNERHEISQENLAALSFAHEQGVMVVIATGRSYQDVKSILTNANCPLNPWIISANGSIIHHPNGEKVHSVPIAKQTAEPILKWLEEEEYYYEVYSEASLLSPQYGRELLAAELDVIKSLEPEVNEEELQKAIMGQYSQAGFSFITSYHDIVSDETEIYNILAFSLHNEKLQKGKDTFRSGNGLSVFSSGRYNFEFTHEDASKGKALEKLGNILQIPLVKMAAIGDNYNDVSMLTMVGRSAAMGNADDEIKKQCHEVTLENVNDGVAHFIYRLLQK